MAEKPPFEACGRLFDLSDAFSHNRATDTLFADAMREALAWHRARCAEFARFLDAKGLAGNASPAPEEIPPLLVTVFKEHRLISIPDSEIKIELTSSGTGGRRSAIVLDKRSYSRILRVVDAIFGSLGLVNRNETADYLCFTYDPRVAKNVGTAFSDKILTGLTRRGSVFYAIRWNKATESFEFDLGTTVRRLLAFAGRGRPVRILGFPAYLWQVCDELEARGKRLDLGNHSFVITGGGWKIHKDREVTKEVFKKRVSGILGLPEENIRDSFGMVEHGIPYVDCEFGRLHVPVFAEARVVDPETLRPLPDGEAGLLHLMTPYLSSYPSISLLTTDRAKLADRCPCGRSGKTLEILGRAGVAKHKGCAITALELLKQ